MSTRKRTATRAGYAPFTYRRTKPRVARIQVRGRFARGGELKFHDVDLDTATVASAGAVTATINIIPQGVAEDERVGRKCTIKSIQWKYQVLLKEANGGATPANSDTVRIILFQDKQANGATALVATVAGILESADYQSFFNLANEGRFNILLDRRHTMNYHTLTATQDVDTFDSCETFTDGTFYKSCNIPLEFDAAAGVITEIRSNNLGVLLISKGAFCSFNSKFRLRFSDGS